MDSESDTSIFTNNQVHLADVPQLAVLEYNKLRPAYRNVSLITTTLVFMFITAISLGFRLMDNEFFTEEALYILAGIAVLYLLSIFMAYFGFKKKSYALRERDIIYNKGLIWQSSTVVPFNRVQHCEISEGPVERMFGLSELKIFTAGGSSSDMSIPGLDPDTANRLKEYIILKTGMDEEE